MRYWVDYNYVINIKFTCIFLLLLRWLQLSRTLWDLPETDSPRPPPRPVLRLVKLSLSLLAY